MEIKMYVPKVAEIPSEYLAPLAQRARDSLGDAASTTPATRGHLVRQAIKDGLLRGMDNLIREDGSVDIVCDPHHEMPLEVENRPLSLTELLSAMANKRSLSASAPVDFQQTEAEMSGEGDPDAQSRLTDHRPAERIAELRACCAWPVRLAGRIAASRALR